MSSKVQAKTLSDSADSARGYKWDVEIAFGNLPSEIINVRAVSIDVPQPNHSPIDINVRQFTKKESGGVEWNELTLTTIETHDYSILKALYNLGNRMCDYETGKQELKKSYSTGSPGLTILLQGLDDSNKVSWQIFGAIMTVYSPPGTVSDKAALVELPFTIAYDYAKLLLL